jgi:hypothetical protein
MERPMNQLPHSQTLKPTAARAPVSRGPSVIGADGTTAMSSFRSKDMSTATISITVDADAARSFCTAPPEERRKLELLLRLRLRELTAMRARPLSEIMDEIGAAAVAKGLTPDDLESMLREG